MSFKERCRERYICIAGFFVLSFSLLLFYSMILFEMEAIVSKLVFLLGLSFLVTGIVLEKKIPSPRRFEIAKKVGVLVAIPVAAVVTFSLSVYASFGAVIASAFVGLSYALIASQLGKSWKKLSAPVYCGSFVGMSSSLVLTELWMIGLAGVLASIVFIISEEVYKGIGGKLGTIGFVGTATVKRLILSLLGL